MPKPDSRPDGNPKTNRLLETVIERLNTLIEQNDTLISQQCELIELAKGSKHREESMAIDLSELITEVEETKGTSASAVALINGLSDKIDELIAGSNDPAVQAQLGELKTALTAARSDLAAAVTANPVP